MADSLFDDAFVRLVTLVRVQLAGRKPGTPVGLRPWLSWHRWSTSCGRQGRLALAVATAGGWGAMITGANTNIRHRDVIFHVQTEDSGRTNPHIISHLYHGGTILASEKTEYGEKIEASADDDLEPMIRGLIESQHKEMLRRLKRGEFDATIEERLGTETLTPAKAAKRKPSAKAAKAAPTDTATKTAAAPTSETAPPTESGLDTKTPVPDLGDLAVAAASTPTPNAGDSRSFGDSIVSQKPLDEVILDYLSEKARSRVDRTSPKRSGG